MDRTGKAQFFLAIASPPEHEGEGDRIFARHAAWMAATHPREGALALLEYSVSKFVAEGGEVVYLLAEVYESSAGIDNHRALAHQDEHLEHLHAWLGKCRVIGGGNARVVHALWP